MKYYTLIFHSTLIFRLYLLSEAQRERTYFLPDLSINSQCPLAISDLTLDNIIILIDYMNILTGVNLFGLQRFIILRYMLDS